VEVYLLILVGLVALALLAQAIVLILAYIKISRVLEETHNLRTEFYNHFGSILKNVEGLSKSFREQGQQILEDFSTISGTSRRQFEKIDEATEEVLTRVRMKVSNVGDFFQRLMENVFQKGASMKGSLSRPSHEVSALVQGIKTAFETFASLKNRNAGDKTDYKH